MSLIDVINAPWAIQSLKLTEIHGIYQTHLRGEKINTKVVESGLGRDLGRKEQGFEVVNGKAIIPIDGVIAQKMNLFTEISGGASSQLIERDIKDALADDLIEEIILDIDSPGGTVAGTSELANFIFNSRGKKLITVMSSGLMASAAYWIGAAADQIFISSETVHVGDIGVVAMLPNTAKAEEMSGDRVIEIYSGKFKRIYSQHAEPTEDGLAYIQAQSDYLYEAFLTDISKFKGLTVDFVHDNMADGRIFIGSQAVDAGLADGIKTFDEVVASGVSRETFGRSATNINIPATAISGDLPDIIQDAVQKAVLGKKESLQAAVSADDSGELSDGDSRLETLETKEESSMDITVESILASNPEIADAFRAEGVASVDLVAIKTEAKTEGTLAGAEAERARILAVKDQSMPGHEDLVQALMFDGKTSGPEAAVAVINAEKTRQASAAASFAAEEIKPVVDVVASDEVNIDNLPLDKKCQALWDKDKDLRAEFNDDFDSYFAFEKAFASGSAKILKK